MHAPRPSRMLLAALATLAACGPGRAPAAPADPCQSFNRSSTEAPEIVRRWLAHSSDDHVVVCRHRGTDAADEPVYTAESRVTHESGVCSYSSHVLVAFGSGPKRALHRYEQGDSVYMARAGQSCPPPYAAGSYTETYDVSPAVFESLLQRWAEYAASAPNHELACGACGASSSRRLQAAIAAGRMKGAPVLRIVRIPGVGLTRRYELFVADPQRAPGDSTLYVIYFERWLRGPWHLNGVADTAD